MLEGLLASMVLWSYLNWAPSLTTEVGRGKVNSNHFQFTASHQLPFLAPHSTWERGWSKDASHFLEKGAGWFLCNLSLSKTSSHKCFHLWSSIMRLQFLQYVAPLPYTLIWSLLVIRLRQPRVLNHILSSMIGGSALNIFSRSLENQSLAWRNKLGWVEPQVPSPCVTGMGPSSPQSFASKYKKNYLLPNVTSCLWVSLSRILRLGMVFKLSHDGCLSCQSLQVLFGSLARTAKDNTDFSACMLIARFRHGQWAGRGKREIASTYWVFTQSPVRSPTWLLTEPHI